MRSKPPPIFCPKRKIILDLLCCPSTPRRRKAVCLVSYQQVLPVCRRRRFCQAPRGRRCYFFCSIPLDVCRRRQLSKRHPISSCGSSHETLQHIRHLSAPGKMDPFEEGNQYSSCLYESLDARRDSSSVSFLMSTLHTQAHNQVPFSAHIHGFTDDQLADADEMFDKYGPTPRICIDFVYNPDVFAQYKAFYDAAM